MCGIKLLGRELANGNTLMKSFLRDIKWNLKLKWLYRFFTQIVYEHLLPVNYIVSKEGISRYDSNRNLFEIIKLQIIYYPRMDRGWNGKFILMNGVHSAASGEVKNGVKIRNVIALRKKWSSWKVLVTHFIVHGNCF